MPPIASFALRGTARELTWYCLLALTPNDAGIAYRITSSFSRKKGEKKQFSVNKWLKTATQLL